MHLRRQVSNTCVRCVIRCKRAFKQFWKFGTVTRTWCLTSYFLSSIIIQCLQCCRQVTNFDLFLFVHAADDNCI